MSILAWSLFFTSAYPLWCAWRANQSTTLSHAVLWSCVAWLGWVVTLGVESSADARGPLEQSLRYLSLCLTGCTGIAVLGARRPGVAAWNFVVGGLLAIFLLFLAEGKLSDGEPRLGWVRTAFLIGTIGVGIINYLPSRLAFPAVLAAAGCGLELCELFQLRPVGNVPVASLLLAAAPWTSWLLARQTAARIAEFNDVWLDFRDRFGGLWALRVREQFNRSAANAGWRIELGWGGLNSLDGTEGAGTTGQEKEYLDALLALLKRFGKEQSGDQTVSG